MKISLPTNKSRLGQFFTPGSIARFMAGLFDRSDREDCLLLDAGAGEGVLSVAFLERWLSGEFRFRRVTLDAFEIDPLLNAALRFNLNKFQSNESFDSTIRNVDFIHAASDWLSNDLFAASLPAYTHAILNPPYKKIRSDSAHRSTLRRAGIETVNVYSAFVALSLSLLADHGQLVAIIPRSFCNGPYYRPFRSFILERAAIRRIHLFDSRDKTFREDRVLQENLILVLERNGRQESVLVSTSTDGSFSDLSSYEYPFERIVIPDDPDHFIHIPTTPEDSYLQLQRNFRHSLSDLRIGVSTGPVVDFRLKEYLRDMPGEDTVPLLYPSHFSGGKGRWPIPDFKKPNAILLNRKTEKLLYHNGYYCVVRRFSSKEEKRRVSANVVDPCKFGDPSAIGFENHLNVFHDNKRGLPKALAYGIAVFLNSSIIDEHFRSFNGHTQVNVTDLKRIKYPSRSDLSSLGEWAMDRDLVSQESIDQKIETSFI